MARAVLDEAREELREEKLAFDEDVPIGIMIEMPSAAVIADVLAQEVDFFSIGTNDLIQYTLAVDRVNEHVSYLYEPLHPALLRLIHMVVQAGRRANVPVSLCGEMAGDPAVAPVLVGLGLEAMSMNAVAIPEIKSVIRKTRFSELSKLAKAVMQMPTAAEVTEAVRDYMASVR
jgi:phosphotransferase system enzyme I (PtsI)